MATHDYGFLTVPQLKLRLLQHGASTRGKKNDFIERLSAYDRYSHLRVVEDDFTPDEILTDWPLTGFKQLVCDHREEIPVIDESQVKAYFVHRQGMDCQQVNDLKALEKGHAMCMSKQTRACSINACDDMMFFSGIVKAAMKKKVMYNFRLKIDKTGMIQNSSCECPAGKGFHATCKHIAAVVYILQNFKRTGILNVEKSGTERLQNFHRPAQEPSAPIKITDLPGALPVDMRDPRPQCFRNMEGYNDVVRNQVFGYCAHTGSDLAIRYIYPKGNIQAAAIDHDYCITRLTEQWVNDSLQITRENAVQLEKVTRAQRNSKEWFKERSWRVTASHFGTICHATARRDTDKLCESMFGSKPLRSPSVLHGRAYEDAAKRHFEEKFNVKVQPCGLFVQPALPFFGATPDGVVGDDAIIEIKCPFTGRNEKITASAHFPFLQMCNGNYL